MGNCFKGFLREALPFHPTRVLCIGEHWPSVSPARGRLWGAWDDTDHIPGSTQDCLESSAGFLTGCGSLILPMTMQLLCGPLYQVLGRGQSSTQQYKLKCSVFIDIHSRNWRVEIKRDKALCLASRHLPYAGVKKKAWKSGGIGIRTKDRHDPIFSEAWTLIWWKTWW